MYKRLKDKQSSYDLNKLLKDYSKNQYYKQNACRYPSINFIKDIKNKSIEPKDHKRKKNIMTCKTENNYFPKIYRTITSNFKSNLIVYKNEKMNTYEGFENLKNKKIKRKKKKFKDFNFKDLKKLKEKKCNSVEKEIKTIKKYDIYKNIDIQKDNEKKIINNKMEEDKNINIENEDINKNISEKNKEKEKKSNDNGNNKNKEKEIKINDNDDKNEFVSLVNNENLDKEDKSILDENYKDKEV